LNSGKGRSRGIKLLEEYKKKRKEGKLKKHVKDRGRNIGKEE
jgi:hypothetical protein